MSEDTIEFCCAHKTNEDALKCKRQCKTENTIEFFSDEQNSESNDDLINLLSSFNDEIKPFDLSIITHPIFIKTMEHINTEDQFWDKFNELHGNEEFEVSVVTTELYETHKHQR